MRCTANFGSTGASAAASGAVVVSSVMIKAF
jgi:hypothetical protein